VQKTTEEEAKEVYVPHCQHWEQAVPSEYCSFMHVPMCFGTAFTFSKVTTEFLHKARQALTSRTVSLPFLEFFCV